MNKNSYLIQLDGIRCLAVVLVLVDHWLAQEMLIRLGHLGVIMFFVLSGFLITRILMTSADKTRDEKGGLGIYLKKFYIRRTLRIFPIYYLTLFVLFVLDVEPVRRTLAWCLLYATNIYMAVNQSWMGVIDHFWSLASEEQYYIFFPFVIFFAPRRWILPALLLMIVTGVLFRAVFFYSGVDWIVTYVSMPGCLDAFGLGGLLAWLLLNRKERFKEIFSKTYLIILGFGVWALVTWWSKVVPGPHNGLSEVWERLAGSIFSFFLIGKAIIGYEGAAKWLLENPVSNYLGKISYGLYIYHNFVYNHYYTTSEHPTMRILYRIGAYFPELIKHNAFLVAYFFSLTVAIASLSWFLIEKPINSIKDKIVA